jgi:hypothetical protein
VTPPLVQHMTQPGATKDRNHLEQGAHRVECREPVRRVALTGARWRPGGAEHGLRELGLGHAARLGRGAHHAATRPLRVPTGPSDAQASNVSGVPRVQNVHSDTRPRPTAQVRAASESVERAPRQVGSDYWTADTLQAVSHHYGSAVSGWNGPEGTPPRPMDMGEYAAAARPGGAAPGSTFGRAGAEFVGVAPHTSPAFLARGRPALPPRAGRWSHKGAAAKWTAPELLDPAGESVLSAGQRAQFHDEGFVIVHGIFPQALIDRCCGQIAARVAAGVGLASFPVASPAAAERGLPMESLNDVVLHPRFLQVPRGACARPLAPSSTGSPALPDPLEAPPRASTARPHCPERPRRRPRRSCSARRSSRSCRPGSCTSRASPPRRRPRGRAAAGPGASARTSSRGSRACTR